MVAGLAGGDTALASKGPGGYGCKLDGQQLARLRAALDSGPARPDSPWNQNRPDTQAVAFQAL